MAMESPFKQKLHQLFGTAKHNRPEPSAAPEPEQPDPQPPDYTYRPPEPPPPPGIAHSLQAQVTLDQWQIYDRHQTMQRLRMDADYDNNPGRGPPSVRVTFEHLARQTAGAGPVNQPHQPVNEETPTMSDQPQTSSPNKPLQSFRDGGMKVTLWLQGKEDKPFVTASVTKSYKNQAGEWKESRNFSQQDMLKLQAMLPEVREAMQYHQQRLRSNEPPRDLAADRDAMVKATDTPSKGKDTPAKNGPGHTPNKTGPDR